MAGKDLRLGSYIYLGHLRSGGQVKVAKGAGEKGGAIMGGETWALQGIDVHWAGTPANTSTLLVAGLGPAFPLLKFNETGTVSWIRNGATDVEIYAGFAVLALDDGSYMIPGFIYLQRAGDAFDAVLLRYDK